jgi:hypothetical protein
MKNWYYDSRLSGKLQEEIKKFSRKVTKGFNKPDRKWISELLYGMLKSKDIKLTNIGRAMRDDISLKYTVKRFSRNLIKKDISKEIIDSYISMACKNIKEDTILSLDLSDIFKESAQKMDNLCRSWDGSKKKVSDKGYWLCNVVGKNSEGNEVIPLYNRLFSSDADDTLSENKEIFKAIDAVDRHVNGKGIWVIDRGGDRRRLYDGILRRKLRFIIRLVAESRHLETLDGKKTYPINIASGMGLHNKASFKSGEGVYNIRFGYKRVFLPGCATALTMVVAKGFGKEEMMLLTNTEVNNSISALRIIEDYIARWVIEESFRFVKQSYCIEDIRLRRYNGLKNMLAIVLLVYGFLSLHLVLRGKMGVLIKHINECAKRLYGIADFLFYALADGISYLLSYYRDKFKVFNEISVKQNLWQLLLFSNLQEEI